ncbi:MAG: ABC transporter permease [Tunicatimonas sp.]
MFKNYLKVGVRNIFKYKVFSFINVFGLAVAMSVCMLIILMLVDQKSYDQFHTKKDRIYRIISEPQNAKSKYATSPVPLANTLTSDYTPVAAATHLIQGVGGDAIYNKNIAEMRGFFADTSFFQVFSYQLEQGDERTALASPNAMVITHALARQLFAEESPLGKTIEFVNRGLPILGEGAGEPPVSWGLFTVTGVLTDKPYKSHLAFDVLVSEASLPALHTKEYVTDRTNDWGYYSYCLTYALLLPEHNQQDLNAALNDLVSLKYADLENFEEFGLSGQALTKITPGPILGNSPTYSLPIMAYYVLGAEALLIMLLACLNYTNLSIARALTRAKEIGVRKVAGARGKDLVQQFLSESVMTALMALALAIVLLFFLKQAFMGLWVNQYLGFDLQENFLVYLIFVGFALLIGVAAGGYPAFRLSTYQPQKVLKNIDTRSHKLGMRRVVSIAQFVVSLFFIVTSLLIYNQFKHFLAYDYGFTSESIINIPLQGNDYALVANELNAITGVAAVSASEYIPATGKNNGSNLRPVGSEAEYQYAIALPVDDHFTDNLGIKLLAGRNLSVAEASASPFILVNEATVKMLGYEHPGEVIGLTLDSKWDETDLEIVGVVEDFRIDLPMSRNETRPMLLRYLPDRFRYANVKLTATDPMGTIARIEAKWKTIDPIHPLKYEFYDQQLAETHQAFLDMVAIIGFIATLAIIIACLGLLGMATYTTERRTKEIGIRKVLGAESFRIALLLSRGFLSILAVSIAIGAPLSYFANNFWLQNFPNRVDFGWGTVLLGSAVLLVLGLVTIGSQTLRAAQRNPVDTLRSE